MPIALPPKAPGDLVDYPIDYSLLLASGEALASIDAVNLSPVGLTLEASSIIGDGVVSLYLSGGVEGETYRIVVEVTTNMGTPPREFQRTFCLTVEDI